MFSVRTREGNGPCVHPPCGEHMRGPCCGVGHWYPSLQISGQGGRRRSTYAVRSRCAGCDRKRTGYGWWLVKAGCAIRQSKREKKKLRRNQREHARPVLVVRMLVVAVLHRMVAGGDLRDQQANGDGEAGPALDYSRVSLASGTSHPRRLHHLSSPYFPPPRQRDRSWRGDRCSPRPWPALAQSRLEAHGRALSPGPLASAADWPDANLPARRGSGSLRRCGPRLAKYTAAARRIANEFPNRCPV